MTYCQDFACAVWSVVEAVELLYARSRAVSVRSRTHLAIDRSCCDGGTAGFQRNLMRSISVNVSAGYGSSVDELLNKQSSS